MKYVISFLAMPLSIFWILLITMFVLYFFKKRKSCFLFLCLSVFWLFFISTAVLSRYPVLLLEQKYEQLLEIPDSITNKETYILVLGSGHTCDTSLAVTNQLNLYALGRLCEGIRLHRQIPNSSIILSGYGDKEPVSHAEMLRLAAIEMGVNDSCIFTQTEAVNTKEEALHFKEVFNANSQLILVTDAIHLPRSCYLFRKAGLSPIPAPTNHLIKESGFQPFLNQFKFSSQNITSIERATYEYLGLLWAFISGG